MKAGAHGVVSKGDALMRRHVAHWRRVTARLQVLMNSRAGSDALADEAHALSRQCERLAAELRNVAGRRAAAAASTREPGS